MTEEDIEAIRQKYIDTLEPLFLPEDPVSNNILLRIVGMEDKGWDPYLESRAILEDLNAIFQTELPDAKFPDKNLTIWRMGLLMYSHIVEMDAPYEVITNLLRFRLGNGYVQIRSICFSTRIRRSASEGLVYIQSIQSKRLKS
jgi:hypothetical protein